MRHCLSGKPVLTGPPPSVPRPWHAEGKARKLNGVGASQFDPEDQHHSLEGVLRATRITLLTCWIGGLFAPFAVSGALLYFQDCRVLLLQLILGGLALTPWGDRFIPQGLRLSFKAVAFIALTLLMFCYAGHY